MPQLAAGRAPATAGCGEDRVIPTLRTRRVCRRSAQRGMVTIELAMGSLAAVGLLIMMCWVIFVVVQQVRCIDLANEVARQAARGDQQAVERVKDDGPPEAEVVIDKQQDVVEVAVRVRVEPFGDNPLALTVKAGATAVWEPGEGSG